MKKINKTELTSEDYLHNKLKRIKRIKKIELKSDLLELKYLYTLYKKKKGLAQGLFQSLPATAPALHDFLSKSLSKAPLNSVNRCDPTDEGTNERAAKVGTATQINNTQPYKLRVCLEPASRGKAGNFFLASIRHQYILYIHKRGEYIFNIFSLPYI